MFDSDSGLYDFAAELLRHRVELCIHVMFDTSITSNHQLTSQFNAARVISSVLRAASARGVCPECSAVHAQNEGGVKCMCLAIAYKVDSKSWYRCGVAPATGCCCTGT